MAVFNLENIANGQRTIPYGSQSLNRTMAWKFHTYPTAGEMDVEARAFGSEVFLPVDGGSSLDVTASGSITIGLPVAEVRLTFIGVTGDPKFMAVTFTEVK